MSLVSSAVCSFFMLVSSLAFPSKSIYFKYLRRGNHVDHGTKSYILYPTCQYFLRLLFVTAGFALLPFLWAVNAVWFSKEAFVAPPYEEQKQIKRCWYRSIDFLQRILDFPL